jgi:hypothetical protein
VLSKKASVRRLNVLLACAAVLVVGCSSDSGHPKVAHSTTTTTTTTAGSAYEQLFLPTGDQVQTCEAATRSSDPAALIGAFDAARLAGKGAEDCLGPEAAAKYRQDKTCEWPMLLSPGPVLLYGCGEHRIVAIPLDEVEAVKVDHNAVQQELYFDGNGQGSQPEQLTIRSTGDGSNRRQLIMDVSPI